MNLKEIRASAAALGNQLAAGIPIYQAVGRLAQLQPAHAEFWTRSAMSVQSGAPISDSLSSVWPITLVNSVKAGERSGKLDGVFVRIEETTALQEEMRGAMMKLVYPFLMGLAGICVFIGFMVFVLPTLAKSLNTKSSGFVFQLSTWMATFAEQNWMIVVGGLVAAVVILTTWLRTPESKVIILDWWLTVPIVRDALRDLYFGLWANYMAMTVTAGITTLEALKLTGAILPTVMRDSVLAFEKDLSVNNRRMAEAADPAKQNPGDPRATWWPFYIANAFIVAEQTGEIDRELGRIAPSLIKEGVTTLNYTIAIANAVAIAISGMLIVAPLAAYYTEIFSAIQQANH